MPRIAGCLLLAAPFLAFAQSWPAKPVHLVTQFAPGSTGDNLCRVLAQSLNEVTGQPVIVDNRAGAGGVLAAESIARAAPDGYSLLVGTTGTQIMRVHLARKSSFDPVKDFTPITEVGETVTLWVAHPGFGPSSFRDMIEYAKQNPGKVAYGTSGIGSPHHLSGELVKLLSGADMLHIPYKASAQALQDTMAGQIPTTFAISGLVVPAVKSGKVKALAIVRDTRFKALPDVPTVGEIVPGFEVPPSWTGLFGPAGMPAAVLQRVHADVVKALNRTDVRQKLAEQHFDVITNATPEEFALQIRRQIDLVGRIVKGAGIKPTD
jgi:tripartite-type tricarboxylate transporter receptor subunit TctC